MRINIIFKDDKVIIETSKKYINLDELFASLRDKYAIDDDKRLILLSETKIYREDDNINHNHMLESNLQKTKEDFVLICLDNYRNYPYKQLDKYLDDPIYSKENVIMKVTGASNPIKQDKKVKQRGKFLRHNIFNNFEMNNLIGYHRYDIISNLEEDNRSNEDLSEHVDTGIMQRYNIPTLLGRIRERDSNQPVELSLYATSSTVREEDINRLVNEMGFPDNSVRIALRMTRNNMNRAVDLLLNNPEELTQENLHVNRPPQGSFERNIPLPDPNNPNTASVNNDGNNNSNTNVNRNTNLPRNFDGITDSAFNLQIPVIPSNNLVDPQNINRPNQQGLVNNTDILGELLVSDFNDYELNFNNNESSNFISAENLIPGGNNNSNENDNQEIVFAPLDEYFQEELEEESSLDDNFILNQDEDEEMEYEHSIQSDENSDEFV